MPVDSRIDTFLSIKQELAVVADHIRVPGSSDVMNLCSSDEETAVEFDTIVQTEAMSPSIHALLTKKSIYECTNLISNFIEEKKDEQHFGRCLFKEFWACLTNQQRYDVDPDRWDWECVPRKSKLQNICGYKTSKKGLEEYFPTPEGVVQFVSTLIIEADETAFQWVEKKKFEDFQFRLSRAIEQNLDFDSVSGEKRKRKRLDIGNSNKGAKKARTSSTKQKISSKQKTNNHVGEEKLADYLLRNFVKKDLKGTWCCRKSKCSFKRKQTAGRLNTTIWSTHVIYNCKYTTPSKVQELKKKYKESGIIKKILSKNIGAKKETNLNQSTNKSNKQKEESNTNFSETSSDDDYSYTSSSSLSSTGGDNSSDNSTSSCTSREENTIEPMKHSIMFNVNGERVGVPESILTVHPHSKIAKLANKEKEPVYLDCDHHIFGQTLNFLRDGKVKLPLNVSKGALVEYLRNLFNIKDINENKIEQDVVQATGICTLSIAYHAEVIRKQHFIWKMVADCTKHLLDEELLKISDTFTIDLSDYDVEYRENVANLCSNKKDTIEECNGYLSKVGLRLENITKVSLKLKKLA